MLDLLMITAFDRGAEWAMGRHETLLSAKKEYKKGGEKAWIAGGCVPLVHVSPISARTDGSRTGISTRGG